MSNSIFTIHPYKSNGQWMFDDLTKGLVREAFVAGADDMLELASAHIPNAGNGVTLIFSEIPFPGHTIELEWVRSESGGNWYYCRNYGFEGWLCPALFCYFEAAPKKFYVQVKERRPLTGAVTITGTNANGETVTEVLK